jgi:hypothetical protein
MSTSMPASYGAVFQNPNGFLALGVFSSHNTAKCSTPGYTRRATTILRYLDNQERPDHQTDACDPHTRGLSAELRIIDRRC